MIPNTPKTKFQIASNTKSFTAFAIMHLQQKNLLNTQDKLNKYINDYQNGDKVTIHHLLTHTSGIPNYYKYWNDVVHSKNLEQMVSSFKSWPLDFEPGTNYSYSNSGYTLLAYIIEKVSGLTYEEFLKENIFKPLGMHDTGSYNLKLVNNRASGYIYEDNIIYNAETPNNPVTLLGNGDLYSSLEDLYKWDRELQKNKDLIFTPHIPMEDSPSRAHGYGWFIDKKFDKRIVEYSGSLRGFLSRIIKFIDDDITVIILSNLEDREEFNIIYEGLLTTIFLEHS